MLSSNHHRIVLCVASCSASASFISKLRSIITERTLFVLAFAAAAPAPPVLLAATEVLGAACVTEEHAHVSSQDTPHNNQLHKNAVSLHPICTAMKLLTKHRTTHLCKQLLKGGEVQRWEVHAVTVLCHPEGALRHTHTQEQVVNGVQ